MGQTYLLRRNTAIGSIYFSSLPVPLKQMHGTIVSINDMVFWKTVELFFPEIRVAKNVSTFHGQLVQLFCFCFGEFLMLMDFFVY